MTFHHRQLNSMTFKAWKMKFLHFTAFWIFHDFIWPCIKLGSRDRRLKVWGFKGVGGIKGHVNTMCASFLFSHTSSPSLLNAFHGS